MKKLLDLFEKHLDSIKKYKIIIVANVRQRTLNYKSFELNQANPIEFFSENEFKEIYTAIRRLPLFTKIYFNELVFFEEVLNETYKANEIIVVNFARNGSREGKKSLVPAFCDLLNIKYTSSNAFVQSLCRNKFIWGNVLENQNLPVAGNVLLKGRSTHNIDKLSENEKYILKPICESSSIGISGAMTKNQIVTALAKMDGLFIAQKYLTGSEYELPFFNLNEELTIFDPIKINYGGTVLNESLSSENDYYYSRHDLSLKVSEYMVQVAKHTVNALGIQKYGRIDFKLDENGNPFVIDIATLPYLTENSSFMFVAKEQNLQYNDIFKALIVIALLHKN